jgi:2-polyprenyl-6-methoxyphenol hydroxylase-like FAD-dependent oxidoreductase
LIAGGSLVGLSSAMFLSARGVRCVLVEPHAGSHPHPRAVGFTPRTLELLRSVGLTDQVPSVPAGFRLRRCRVDSLAGTWHEESPWTPGAKPPAPAHEDSPVTGAAIAQDRLEPILRAKALELGAELRLGTSLTRFEQDGSGVTAWLADSAGHESTLRAQVLIAADGHRSPVREALGIPRTGPGPLRTLRSVLFRAPLEQYLEKGVHQFEVQQPGFEAFLTTYGDGRWVLMFTDDDERDEASLRAAIVRAIGRDDLPIEIITTGRWELTALIADRFREGRVFLAGDSAHTLPPTRGGFGANTGIHDAHNLAWKLEAVLAGTSNPALLDTYDAERRPIAWTRLLQTFARPDYARAAKGFAQGVALFDDVALELGQLYRSAGIAAADASLPDAALPETWSGQPGTRALHRWISRGGQRVSTLDLFGTGWVLISGDRAWSAAAAHAAGALAIPLEHLCVGADVQADDPAALLRAFGISRSGASLARPDGHVAWRAVDAPADAPAALTRALSACAFAAKTAAR